MKCPLCGMEFNPEHAQKACAGCPLAKGCNLVKCPNCGYEVPKEPEFIKKLKKKRRREDDA